MSFATIELNQHMLPVLLGLLLVSAAAWLFLSNRLYRALRDGYPDIYEALGNPGLFMRKSVATNIRILRFLFRRDYEKIKNPAVSRLCQGLRHIFIIYAICFGGCILLLLDKMP